MLNLREEIEWMFRELQLVQEDDRDFQILKRGLESKARYENLKSDPVSYASFLRKKRDQNKALRDLWSEDLVYSDHNRELRRLQMRRYRARVLADPIRRARYQARLLRERESAKLRSRELRKTNRELANQRSREWYYRNKGPTRPYRRRDSSTTKVSGPGTSFPGGQSS